MTTVAITGRADRDLLMALANAGGYGVDDGIEGCPPAQIIESRKWFFDGPTIILGDTASALAVAFARHLQRQPIIHIHGGEITRGSYDDSMRHAISKLACLHFVVGEEEKARLIRMGEQPNTVHVVGSIGAELASRVPRKMNTEHPFYLFTWHNPTWVDEDVGEILKAFDAINANVLVTGTNNDPGSDDVREKIAAWVEANPDRVAFAGDMGVAEYHKAMSECIAVVGNSSSGIFEAPAMGVPVVNIGRRQEGRRPGTPCQGAAIWRALAWTTTDIVKLEAETAHGFYLRDHGSTIASIVRIINASLPLSPVKTFYDP